MGRKTTTTGPSSFGGSKRAEMKSSTTPAANVASYEPKQPKVIIHPLLMSLTNMNYALAIMSTLLDVTLLLVGELSSQNTWMSTFLKQLGYGTLWMGWLGWEGGWSFWVWPCRFMSACIGNFWVPLLWIGMPIFKNVLLILNFDFWIEILRLIWLNLTGD